MGTMTVYFVGICTHLREFTSRETEHRVVMINAREDREINGETIVGHEASLVYEDADGKPQRVALNGVRITANAVDAGVVYAPSFFTCIPRLTACAPQLPSLSMDVAKGRDPQLVAAYFDAAGRFIAGADDNEASVAALQVVTHDPPTLTLEPFDGSAPSEIRLSPDAAIQIENVGPGTAEGDRTHDFLLNFLVAQFVPEHADWPKTRADCPPVKLPFPSNTVDPGCSNSNYP